MATLSRIDKRKKKLNICNWLTYSVFVIGQVLLTYFFMNTNKFEINSFGIQFLINSIFMMILAVLSLCAMWHIQRNSRDLKQLGIFANAKLFRVYTISWVGASLT